MDENEDIPYDEVDAGVPLKPRTAWSAEEDARLARCARASRAGRSRPLASASPRESRVRFVSLARRISSETFHPKCRLYLRSIRDGYANEGTES